MDTLELAFYPEVKQHQPADQKTQVITGISQSTQQTVTHAQVGGIGNALGEYPGDHQAAGEQQHTGLPVLGSCLKELVYRSGPW